MFPTVSPVIVEEVGKGLPWREFADLAVAIGAAHPGAEWLLAGQRRRLRKQQPPDGEAALLLARRDGRPVARLSAHRQPDGEGSFGFLAIEGRHDVDAVAALLAAAAGWLSERGSPTMVGPLSWTAAEEAGVLVEGNEAPAMTGRAWNPPWYGEVLQAAGLEVADELCSYRLSALGSAGAVALTPAEFVLPEDVGPYADPALLLLSPDGHGSVIAVPDVAGGLGGPPGGRGARGARSAWGARGAWSMARQARRREWTSCAVTALDGDASVLIPGLCAAAARAGYEWVLSPWAPDGRAPVMRHRLYRGDTGPLRSDLAIPGAG
jgi:hypothetical protein